MSLKESFLEVYGELGGSQGLIGWAGETEDNKKKFYQMASRMLPKELATNSETDKPSTVKVLTIPGKAITNR